MKMQAEINRLTFEQAVDSVSRWQISLITTSVKRKRTTLEYPISNLCPPI